MIEKKSISVRELALKTLDEIESNGAYSNIAIERQKRKFSIAEKDNAFLHELVYGVIKRKVSLDHIIFLHSKLKRSRISVSILSILRMGVYQIVFLDKVPVSAAVNESVKLAKRYGNEGSIRFVNAVLRKISRYKENQDKSWLPDPDKDPLKYLSVLYSYPEWICERWTTRYGREFAETLLDAGNWKPDFTIRTNKLRISREALIDKLSEEGFSAQPGKYAPEAVVIDNPGDFTKSASFLDGLFTVQDESSMMSVLALEPKSGENILDVCCAPGGKCSYIAEYSADQADILACDVFAHKLQLVEQNNLRLGLKSVRLALQDALEPDESLKNSMDRVLVDAPCSGLGIIRKKPEIKWTKSVSDIKNIAAMQLQILNNVAQYLKKDGILVYSVCTTEPEEGEQVIEKFLENNPDFSRTLLPKELPVGGSQFEMRLFPNIHGIDGFYIAKLRKRNAN